MTFKQWVLDLLKDERGATSIKPVVALACTIFLCLALVANAFNHTGISPSDALVNAVMYVCIGAMIGDTGDKFSLRKKQEKPEDE
jgi:uncharacterized membrane protein YtjA (UPF0391 family)